MKSIPAEILSYIFRFLHQNDKLQCMQVCHEWNSVIKSTVLFETLIISSKEGLESLQTIVHDEPSYGAQVKRLLFQVNPDKDSDSEFDLSTLPKLFPNVADLYINAFIKLQSNNGFQPWHNKLKRFFRGDTRSFYERAFNHESEFHPADIPEQVRRIFESNIWSNLTVLQLCGGRDYLDSKLYLDNLRYTPAITDLKLHSMDFGMDDFEFIHTALPSLNSLFLTEAYYIADDAPKDIVPAYSVTSFSMIESTVSMFLEKEMLFLYLLQKYPNLSELSIGIDAVNEGDMLNDDAEFFRDGWDRVLANIAPSLQKLHICLHSRGEYEYVLRALDKYNCQLKSLTLDAHVDKKVVNLLPDLNQSKYLQSLKIMHWGADVYKRLKLMKMLTELDFVDSYDGMETAYFNDLVNMFGENLESLKITHLKLKCRQINVNNGNPLVFPQIKKLELNSVCLSSNIGTFISRSFPQLHTLKLKECFNNNYYDTKQGEYFIMIPNVNLYHLQIIDTFGPDAYVIVVTLCDNKRRVYTTKSGKKIDRNAMEKHFGLRDSVIFPTTVSMDYDKKPVTPIVTIICNSLKDIFLSGI